MTPFDALQFSIAKALAADDRFPGVYLDADNPATLQLQPKQAASLARRPKDLGNEFAAALSISGLAFWTMPPMPERSTRAVSDLLFYERVSVCIRCIEIPALNDTGWDIYDAMYQLPRILQWTNHYMPDGTLITRKPLQISERPAELAERAVLEDLNEAEARLLHLYFDCAMNG